MSFMAKVALLFVVFVDLISQGLVFPILNELIMDPPQIFWQWRPLKPYATSIMAL